MGTINIKGHKKLPPSPVALNEIEIENFGLEDLEFEEPEEEDDNIILDSAEKDDAATTKAAVMEEAVQTVYKGLRVEDMVKVTAKNKFFDEDGIVRRLKDGKVVIRFYTYGSTFDEWLDPGDVRKMSDEEVLVGLSGPSQPITQQDFDDPSPGEDERRPGAERRNLPGQMGGDRNRRQDRVSNRFQQGESQQDHRKERDNWNSYKDNERRNQDGAYSDGDIDIRGSNRERNRPSDMAGPSRDRNRRSDLAGPSRDRNRQGNFAQGDVDSQWGRTSQQNNRPDQRQKKEMAGKPRKGEGDWNSFVSPASSTPSQDETDDFFASLMTDLSNDLDGGSSPKQKSGRSKDSGASSSDEDDFFASLMSEIAETENTGETENKGSSSKDSGDSSTDGFFASLDLDIKGDEEAKQESGKKASSAGDDLDDFFAELVVTDAEDDIGGPKKGKPNSKRATSGTGDALKELAVDSAGNKGVSDVVNGDADDFFSGLEAELKSELSMKPQKTEETTGGDFSFGSEFEAKKTRKKSSPEASEPSSSPANAADLNKCTVPVLKDMLRERGLKVSGKKSELLERLSS
jgi:hypothetical protein